MQRSRIAQHNQSQSKKTMILSIVGIVVIIFLLFQFGIPVLINITSFISGAKDTEDNTGQNKDQFVAPPVLNPQPIATNSAKITVSGYAQDSQTIKLYVNNDLKDTTKTAKDGSFEFTGVTLSKNDNSIKAKAVSDDGQSSFSESFSIMYISEPPKLDLTSPSDGESHSKDDKKVSVSGKTDTGVRITINDFRAVVDENGNFSYSFPLKDGDNEIKIIATDSAGNQTTKTVKVTYSP